LLEDKYSKGAPDAEHVYLDVLLLYFVRTVVRLIVLVVIMFVLLVVVRFGSLAVLSSKTASVAAAHSVYMFVLRRGRYQSRHPSRRNVA